MPDVFRTCASYLPYPTVSGIRLLQGFFFPFSLDVNVFSVASNRGSEQILGSIFLMRRTSVGSRGKTVTCGVSV